MMRITAISALLLALSAAAHELRARPGAAASIQTSTRAPDQLSPAEKAAGWKPLFDGRSTRGWRGYRKKGFPSRGWVIEDGCLHVQSKGGGGDIVTTEQYGDFELALQWRVAAKANSGIMYRVSEKHGAPWQTGPEFQLLDDVGRGVAPTHHHSAGALYDLRPPAAGKQLAPVGGWNETRIRLKDERLEHWLNGQKIVEIDLGGEAWRKAIARSKFRSYEGFGLQKKGHIALQDHGDDVWFRRIRVRDLDAPLPGEVRLLDTKDLSGWTAVLEGQKPMEDVFTNEDGILVCKGVPSGYLRTRRRFESYVLKLEWRFDPVTRTTGKSGVLLRAAPEGTIWPGCVEAQLESGSAGDIVNLGHPPFRSDPARTKGIITKKLEAAERAIGEWNEYEIVMDGPKLDLYVNGQHVNHVDQVSVRSGHICLQSEGVPIHFRHVRLAPIVSER